VGSKVEDAAEKQTQFRPGERPIQEKRVADGMSLRAFINLSHVKEARVSARCVITENPYGTGLPH
jgi:hypothetical protein